MSIFCRQEQRPRGYRGVVSQKSTVSLIAPAYSNTPRAYKALEEWVGEGWCQGSADTKKNGERAAYAPEGSTRNGLDTCWPPLIACSLFSTMYPVRAPSAGAGQAS